MDYPEFLDYLRKTPRKWTVVNGNIRIPKVSYGFSRCPITAVCDLLGGEYYPPFWWVHAAREIGLPSELANRIVDAADARGTYDSKLREDLLRVTDLDHVSCP